MELEKKRLQFGIIGKTGEKINRISI